jgi:predicted acetyltransferase
VIELVLPDVRFESSYLDAERERAIAEDKVPVTAEGFVAMLDALAGLRDGTRIPDGFTQTLELWLVEGKDYLGKVQLRAQPAPHQGHVGIVIRPSRRRQGLARRAGTLARPHLAALGIDEIVATCDAVNAASRTLIESAGGVLVERGAMLRYVIR